MSAKKPSARRQGAVAIVRGEAPGGAEASARLDSSTADPGERARSGERFVLDVPPDLDLDAVVASHGWIQLRPFGYDEERREISFVLRTATPEPLPVRVRPGRSAGRLAVVVPRRLDGAERERVRSALRRIVAADLDLAPFHAHCRRNGLRWVANRRLGRFLRGEDVFEDLAKTLLTTNCTWRQTIGMVDRLVTAASGGASIAPFPAPAAVVALREERLSSEVKVGYRARALRELAERALAGELDGLASLDGPAFLKAVKRFRGFGDYAAASMLLLLGHLDHQVVDSWALARAREVHGLGRRATEARVRRLYAPHAPFRGAAAWFDLNREEFRRRTPTWA